MSNEELLEAFGEIRSDFIMDARQAVQKKCVHSVRKIAVLTAAAAMLIALAGTAVAYFSEADWFMTYFSQRTEEPLTTQQNQYIEDQTVSIGQSATSGGVTVTLESAFSDGYSGFVNLQVASPEEINL